MAVDEHVRGVLDQVHVTAVEVLPTLQAVYDDSILEGGLLQFGWSVSRTSYAFAASVARRHCTERPGTHAMDRIAAESRIAHTKYGS